VRSRLTTILVLLMAGTLLVAGVGTLLVTRAAARNDATRQLLIEATTFASASSKLQTPRVLKVVDDVLRPEQGRIVVITAAGVVETSLPANLTAAELTPAKLLAGEDVTGRAGGTVFAAVPAQLSPPIAAALPPGAHVAVLLTRQIGTLGPSWLYVLLVSGLTLLAAAVVAAWLARRITRPLVEASTVTRRIAGGELTARVAARADEYPELASLGESINSMAARLQGGRERERQLLLSVSHDLRTPLTSIRGYAEALEDGVTNDVAAAAGVIVSESRRLERLVGDLLDLARLGADQLSLHMGPTDVAAVAGAAVEAFRPQAERAGLALEVSAPASGVLVAADPDRLGQVFANLVENSLSFASGAVTVRLSAPPGDPARPGNVYVLVDDDGPGIAPEDLQRVFDRFYQADRGVAARRGLGLGLSIVAELVRAMGGHVRAESPLTPLGGTRMVVELRPWPAATAPRA
jgi:two-component system sensor histidine kinase BaeS